MKIIDPKNLTIVKGLPPMSKKGDKIAFDTEFFNMQKSRLHRPHGDFAFLGATYDGQTVYYITDPNAVDMFLGRMNAGVWIGHNLKFDITQLRRFAKIPQRKLLWDTMILDQIMYSGYYNDFALADLVRRRLDAYLPKEIRAQFSDDGETDVLEPEIAHNQSGRDSEPSRMTSEMLEYACADVSATWLVYQSQRAEIDETDLKLWKDIERDFLWTLLDMRGMKMDVKAWTDLFTKNRAEADAIQKQYIKWDESKYTMEEAIKKKKYVGINLGSPLQVKNEIISRGYKIKTTNEDDIAPFIEDEFIRDVLEFRGKSKLSSTYGSSWIKNGIIEEDDCVYSSFNQIGASTGRISSSKPNVENIPVRETPEFRKAFIAEDGFVLIDADWSAQEPRIAAYLSGDEQLIEIFKAKKDVYIEAARLMFGWELTKKDERRSKRMKPTVLGASYGLTEYGMEKKYEIPKEEGRELLDTFFDTFPGMKEWKTNQQKIRDYVTTIYGRKFWLNPYMQGSENNALNSPVQGSGGDGIKIAGNRFRDEIYNCGYQEDVFIINFIHDEILVMARESKADEMVKVLQRVMIETAENMHEGIPADVEIKVGHTWHDAH